MSLAMPHWQYAQLTVELSERASKTACRRLLWQGPGQGAPEDHSSGDQAVVELLNRFGADGWELIGLQQQRESESGPSYWDVVRSVSIYTFKRLAAR
jgi:hypothetical protein